MREKVLFVLSGLGVLAGVFSAWVAGEAKPSLPPAFPPAANPYEKGVFANGIVESDQPSGENVNLYPEVSGTVVRVLASEGQVVAKGTPLLELDDSVQAATVEQLAAQAEAARAVLEELKAQPRKETLEIARAQVVAAEATLATAKSQYRKIAKSYKLDPRSVSADTLDNAAHAVRAAEANLEVVKRQLELTRAGAWSFDVESQARQYDALSRALDASRALLAKYVLRAPVDGTVLAMRATEGSYVSPQGLYGTYTQGLGPVVVMGRPLEKLNVRCFVDEILISRLAPGDGMQARAFVRGTDISVPLSFLRMQPYVTPKIELSNARQERVDLRVLPVIFRVDKPPDLRLYPGQLVDVYIRAEGEAPRGVGRRPVP